MESERENGKEMEIQRENGDGIASNKKPVGAETLYYFKLSNLNI